MAELLIKIGNNGPDPAYQDGDIVCAFNDRRIRCVHAQEICQITMRNQPFNTHGLRDLNHLARLAWFENVSEFRFERVSATEVKRIRLATLEEEVLSNTPNAQGEYIDVPLYLARRKLHERHIVFGQTGSEIWYGGKTDMSDAKLNSVWTEIERRTAEREVNYSSWPLTPIELRHFLALRVDDLSDARASTITSPLFDNSDPPQILKKREYQVNWRLLDLGSVREVDVEDRNTLVDTRSERSFLRNLIVLQKL